MKEKSKKILKRVGAALLLGLSFLNFGSSWGRQRAKSVPRRAQNIRKETQEEVDSEVQQIADIAEKEAMDVINQEMQQQEQQQQLQQQSQTISQLTLKYAAIGGWGIAMAVFFTSMIFNQPFGLGKAVLSLLPGEPHVAKLEIVTEKKSWQVGETINAQIILSTNEEKVNYFKSTIAYNPEILKLQKIKMDKSKFDHTEQNKVDKKNGIITIMAKKTGKQQDLKKDKIAELTFEVLKETPQSKIDFIKNKSFVIKTKQKDNKGYNILGMVKGVNINISGKVDEMIKCTQIDIVKSRMNRQEWERLINSAPIPLKNGNNWKNLDELSALLCGYSEDGGLYILAHSNKNIEKLQLMNTLTGKKIKPISTDSWNIGDSNFYTITIDDNTMIKEKPGVFRNLTILLMGDGQKQRWPRKGSGEIVLINK